MELTFSAPCLFGIEGILGDELRRLGAKDVSPENGRVLFGGDLAMLARANIQSRYAERIQIQLASFEARSFEELFQGVKAIAWEEWIGKTDAFPVKGWSLNSVLHSVPDCQAIIKKAVAERLKTAYHESWFEETGAVVQIQFTILKDRVSILLDTSGLGLHKRGYRAQAMAAPIKETLAAAIGDVMRVRFADRVVDPCCGSGTLLIEAGLAACRIAPGISRRFVSQGWDVIPQAVWDEERERARSLVRADAPIRLEGGDIDQAALRLFRENAAKAGLADRIDTRCRDLAEFRPDGESGVVLCNPPYGERLGDLRTAQALIRTMGRVFVPKQGWKYGIISPDERFEELFGRAATKRRKLYNGMLKCTLYLYL